MGHVSHFCMHSHTSSACAGAQSSVMIGGVSRPGRIESQVGCSEKSSQQDQPGGRGGTTGTGQTVVYFGWQDASESPAIPTMRFWLVTPGHRRRSQRGDGESADC